MSPADARHPVTVVGLISAVTGCGRTGAITNLAWILAGAGKRVLVVDWGTERPAVHDYLRPFLVAEPSIEELPGYEPDLFPGRDPESGPIVLRHYAVPAGIHSVHVLCDPAGAGLQPPAGPRVAKWKQRLHELRYDFVLIDGPTDTSPDGLARVAALCDVVLVFFLARRAAVEEAAGVARAVAEADVAGPRVIPVTTQFDDQNDRRTARSRDMIREIFADVHPAVRPLPVEVPYHPYDEYDEALAVLVDEPGRRGTLLAAYELLTAAITGGEVDALTPSPKATRDRYRHRLGLPAPETAWRIAVAYAVPDRPWADWVRQRLERAGATVLMVSPEQDWPAGATVPSLVVISSPHLSGSPAVAQIARVTEGHGQDGPVDVIGVRVPSADERTPAGGADPSVWITVGNRPELEVGGELLARFGLFDEPGEQGRATIRFPGDAESPALHNLPPRSETFTGRDTELEQLRDLLTGHRPVERCAFAGPSGVGKSEIIREYAHRFGFHYDLVWWIPAHDPIAAQASLLRLADAKLTTETGDAVGAVLAAISAGEWYERSLLVYDNVNDFDQLAELNLLPAPGAVDVLATTRGTAPGWHLFETGAFTQRDSGALLRSRVTGLTVADAERVGAALGRLPLAVGLAASWLDNTVAEFRAAGESTQQAAEHATGDLVARLDQSDVDDRVAGMLDIVRTSLERTPRGRLAMRVAQMCAFLSTEGVALRLLRSEALLTQLRALAGADADELRLDTGELDQVLWTGTRYGLFEVTWGDSAAVLMHRALGRALRAGEHVARTQSAVLAGLAAYAPSEVTEWSAGTRAKFAELQRHIFISGALHADDAAVRRWLVNHLRFLYRTGDGVVWRYALDVAVRTAERWRAAVGADDELLLRMLGQIANLYRALGDFGQASQLDESVLDTQRRVLGNRHRQTLISTRARAADLRSVGHYEEAYAEDHEAREGLRETLGDDHEHTRMAAHNLAISAHLTGDTRTALAIQRDHHARQARLLGRQHPNTWTSAASVGVYLRELGHYRAAADMLAEALHVIGQVHRNPRHPDVLWIEWQLAIARRRQFSLLWARESNTKTVKMYRELYGRNHPNTRACHLSLAADYHAYGDDETAIAIAGECLTGYEHDVPEHPVTAVCRMNLALYLRGGGRWAEARHHGESAVDALTDLLGETHPWALNATNNYATTLVGLGELEAAVRLATQSDVLCRDVLGSDHPYSVISGRNLDHMLERPGDGSWDELDIDVLPI